MSNSKLFMSFFLFFFFVSFASSSSSSFNNTHRCSAQQSHALLLFKQNLFSTNHSFDSNDFLDSGCRDWLGSDYYPIMMNWKASTDCCKWDGVTCNHFTGDVIGLDLSCGMLRGTIDPNTTLFNLPHLQRLNLAFNDFPFSQLPHEIGRFSNSLTHLNIADCGFTGQVPIEITLLPNLVSLDLSRNLFDSRIPPHVLNSLLHNSTLLRDLSLSGVNISVVLPTYLNISSSLKLLDLSSTSLQGKLPSNIFHLLYLEGLELSGNLDLIGPLPKVNTSINIPLKFLCLSSTGVSGEIPYSVGHLKSLNYLDLSQTNLSGEIPNSIGHLKYLNTLLLYSCGLMGPIPNSLVNLSHLTSLVLSYNMLTGILPSWLFTLPSLENIYLSENMFYGSLPLELFTLRSLKQLSLRSNQFVGKIDVLDQGPTQQTFQQLVNLTHLDLSFNNFKGDWELDTLLSSLTTLVELRLSYSGLSVITHNANHYINPDFQSLRLISCKLTVFPESFRSLKNLQRLDLSNNEIRGHIPDWVGEIGGNELFHLNLSHNFITGFPQQFQWDHLEYLDLQSNLIQGPFPPSICNLSNLVYLDLSNNNFSGVIPQCFGNISFSLQMIDMGNNHFQGIMPNYVYGNCGVLLGLILNGNLLEGEVPSFLSECPSLEVLDLGNNHFDGTFPDRLGRLSMLKVLVLKSNKLHGPIESSSMIPHPFRSLKILDLSHNKFVGHLPGNYFQNFDAIKDVVKKGTKPEYLYLGAGKYYSIIVAVKDLQLKFTKILVDYTIVDLSNNKFEGEIPNVINSLNSLKVFNLSRNKLTGRIPYALGNLSEIESFDLSWNQLTGEIPQSLVDLTTLEVLNLSQNHLVGRIPQGKQFNTFEGNSFEGNSGLCGFPLPKHCEDLSSLQLEADGDEESGFTWKAVMLGYGCGTVVGLAMGYVMLSTGRPKWFNAIADAGEQMIHRWRNKRRYIYIGK